MSGERILVIGIDPKKIDYSDPFFKDRPDLTAETIQAEVDRDRVQMAADGLAPTVVPIDPAPDAAEQAVRYALSVGSYALVMIGGGMKADPERLTLFERLSSLISELAPGSRIAFNTSPDTPPAAAANAR
jgi:hypothetical protein